MSDAVSRKSGHPLAFIIALAIIIIWLVSGPVFHFSDTWQLVINTTTTIITFLMVFLIQNAQGRDTLALQLKLDELIEKTKKARNSLIDIEELSEGELELIRERYKSAASRSRKRMAKKA